MASSTLRAGDLGGRGWIPGLGHSWWVSPAVVVMRCSQGSSWAEDTAASREETRGHLIVTVADSLDPEHL